MWWNQSLLGFDPRKTSCFIVFVGATCDTDEKKVTGITDVFRYYKGGKLDINMYIYICTDQTFRNVCFFFRNVHGTGSLLRHNHNPQQLMDARFLQLWKNRAWKIFWEDQLEKKVYAPGKLTFWTQKWRFGRWFSFSNRWISGSMLIFQGCRCCGHLKEKHIFPARKMMIFPIGPGFAMDVPLNSKQKHHQKKQVDEKNIFHAPRLMYSKPTPAINFQVLCLDLLNLRWLETWKKIFPKCWWVQNGDDLP